MKKIKVAIIGGGSRGIDVYGTLFKESSHYQVVALCDKRPVRLELAKKMFKLPDNRLFNNEKDFFSKKLGDLCVIATQDQDHVSHTLKALKLGYDVLCEKPITPKKSEALKLLDAQKKYNKKVVISHVLRYAPAYLETAKLIDQGAIGRLVDIHAIEQVGFWHQAHSFVRGNWRNSSTVSCKDYVSVTPNATSPTVRVDVKNLSKGNLVIGLSIIRWNGSKDEWKDDFSASQNIVTGNSWNTICWDLTDYDIKTKDEIAGVFIKVKLQNASSSGYTLNCLLDNIDIIDEYPLPKYRGYELKQGVEFSKTFTPAISPTDGVFTFDIYFTSSSNTFIDFILFYTKDWSKYFGYFQVKGDGTLADTYNGVSISTLTDGYHRVILNLAQVTKMDGGSRPTENVNHFWVRTNSSTASGYIDIQPTT